MANLEAELGFSPPPYRMDYESMRTDLGIGILGLHWVVHVMHLPAYVSAGYRIVAGCDNVPEQIDKTRRKFGLDRTCQDLNELMAMDEVQVVDCSFGHAPSKERRRMEAVEAAGRCGKHLMLHKPIASTVGLAEDLARAGREAGITLACNHNARYNPAPYTIKQLLTPKRLGRPGIIELRGYWKGSMPSPFITSKAAPASFIIHHCDLIRWWAGGDCISVYARGGQASNLIVYEFDNGVLAYQMESACGVEDHKVPIRIVAEKGTIEAAHNWNWHLAGPGPYEYVHVHVEKNGPPVRLPLPQHVYEPRWTDINPWEPRPDGYYDLAGPIAGLMGTMGQFQQAIHEGRQPDNAIDGAIASLRMAAAVEISARENRPINPAEVPAEYTLERP